MHLNLGNVPIKHVTHAKFLGITLSEELSWKLHYEDLKKRANSRIFQLLRLRYMGISQRNLLKMYKGCIRPLLTYANAAWINSAQFIIDGMQVLQNKALRLCLSKPRYTRIADLHSESRIPLIRDFQLTLAKRYLHNAQVNVIPNIVEMVQKRRMCPKTKFQTPLDVLLEDIND